MLYLWEAFQNSSRLIGNIYVTHVYSIRLEKPVQISVLQKSFIYGHKVNCYSAKLCDKYHILIFSLEPSTIATWKTCPILLFCEIMWQISHFDILPWTTDHHNLKKHVPFCYSVKLRDSLFMLLAPVCGICSHSIFVRHPLSPGSKNSSNHICFPWYNIAVSYISCLCLFFCNVRL